MPGCDCQHCAKDNGGKKQQARRCTLAQVVAFVLDNSPTGGDHPLPDICIFCALKYNVKLSQRSYFKNFPTGVQYHILDAANKDEQGNYIKVPVKIPLSALSGVFEE
jgi:hypothetical protein